MKHTTTDIYQVNDSFFHKIFDNPENARDFLKKWGQARDVSHADLIEKGIYW